MGLRRGTRGARPIGARFKSPSRSPIAASLIVAGLPFRGRRERRRRIETALVCPGGVSGRAASRELEAQQPPARVLIVRGSELPFSGRLGRQAGEILAWTGIFESFVDDIA